MRAADRGRRCFGVRRKGHEASEGDQVANGTSPAAKDDGLSLRPARDRTASRPIGGGERRIDAHAFANGGQRSEEHTSELQSLMRISYAVLCLKKTQTKIDNKHQS